MSDIWSGIGVEISKNQGEWLYRVKGEIHGPVPKQRIVDKLLAGQIDLKTQVAIEGGEFHPIGQVAAFADALKKVKVLSEKKQGKKTKQILLLVLLLVLLGGGGVGYVMYEAYTQKQIEIKKEKTKLAIQLKKEQVARAKVGKMELVALVTLGSEDEVKIRSTRRKTTGTKKGSKAKKADGSESEATQMVSACERGTGDILGTLGRHVAKLNVCVLDEKKRDLQNLLPSTLPIDFVVRPDGKVVDFQILNRHYRKGALNNCMLKAFKTINFPSVKGSNCPVTLPLKIGS